MEEHLEISGRLLSEDEADDECISRLVLGSALDLADDSDDSPKACDGGYGGLPRLPDSKKKKNKSPGVLDYFPRRTFSETLLAARANSGHEESGGARCVHPQSAVPICFVWENVLEEARETLLVVGPVLNRAVNEPMATAPVATVPMLRDHHGGGKTLFHVTLALLPGKYRYRFLVDGTWHVVSDHAVITDDCGSAYNVVEVGKVANRSFPKHAKRGPGEPGGAKQSALKRRLWMEEDEEPGCQNINKEHEVEVGLLGKVEPLAALDDASNENPANDESLVFSQDLPDFALDASKEPPSIPIMLEKSADLAADPQPLQDAPNIPLHVVTGHFYHDFGSALQHRLSKAVSHGRDLNDSQLVGVVSAAALAEKAETAEAIVLEKESCRRAERSRCRLKKVVTKEFAIHWQQRKHRYRRYHQQFEQF